MNGDLTLGTFIGNAPYAEVKMIGRAQRSSVALLDTGSLQTFVPLDVLEELGLTASGMEKVRGITGEGSFPVFDCTIELAGQRFVGKPVLGSDDIKFPIVGRDIIQNFRLDLDWKNGTVDIEDPP
jgi:predicted aspartyl protease